MSRWRRWESALNRVPLLAFVLSAATWAMVQAYVRPPVAVAVLEGVNRVEVAVRGQVTARQTDPASVAALVAFTDGVRGGWRGTWHTLPSPPVRACYFNDAELRHCVAAGRDILVLWGSDARGLQSATPEQTRRFAALTGVDATLLDRW